MDNKSTSGKSTSSKYCTCEKVSSHLRPASGYSIGKYTVHSELGGGRYSKVWKCTDATQIADCNKNTSITGGTTSTGANPTNGNNSANDNNPTNTANSPVGNDNTTYAIKIYRHGADSDDAFNTEINILSTIATATSINVIKLISSFDHLVDDRLHRCLVLQDGGPTLRYFNEYVFENYGTAIPLKNTKDIMRQLLGGLAYIHDQGFIHVDIKTANLLVGKDCLTTGNLALTIVDFGSATTIENPNNRVMGTTCYLAPEVIIDDEWDESIDVWAAFAVSFELFAGCIMFDVFAEHAVNYGEDADTSCLEGIVSTGNSTSTSNDGVSTGNSTSTSNDGTTSTGNSTSTSNSADCKIHGSLSNSSCSDDDMSDIISARSLLLITKILGYPDKDFLKIASKYYTRLGKLNTHPDLEIITLYDFVSSNSSASIDERNDFVDFLSTGIAWSSSNRVTAKEALLHKWLID